MRGPKLEQEVSEQSSENKADTMTHCVLCSGAEREHGISRDALSVLSVTIFFYGSKMERSAYLLRCLPFLISQFWLTPAGLLYMCTIWSTASIALTDESGIFSHYDPSLFDLFPCLTGLKRGVCCFPASQSPSLPPPAPPPTPPSGANVAANLSLQPVPPLPPTPPQMWHSVCPGKRKCFPSCSQYPAVCK